VKFGTGDWGERIFSPLRVPNFTFIGARVTPAGEKPIFGSLSKNNTGMAALRAGLPVINGNQIN